MNDASVFFHFSFPGGGGLFPLLLGKALAFRKYLRAQIPDAKFLYSGISSGSFVALLLALELSEAEIDQFIQRYLIEPVQNKWYLIEQFHLWYFLKRNLRRLLGTNGYQILDSIYRVGIAKLNPKNLQFQTEIIDTFQNSEDVVNAILASSHIAILGRQPFRVYRNFLAVDGGLTCDHIMTEDLPVSYRKRTVTFRLGYESFPKHILHFQQAMPLFTQAKWQRMYQEGVTSFETGLKPKLEIWLKQFWIPLNPDKSLFLYVFPRFDPKIQAAPEKSTVPASSLRGLTTGWIEIMGGYMVWGLTFTWRFILNNPL